MSEHEIDRILNRLDDPENGLAAIRANQKWIKESVEKQADTLLLLLGEGLPRCRRHSDDIRRLKEHTPVGDDSGSLSAKSKWGALMLKMNPAYILAIVSLLIVGGSLIAVICMQANNNRQAVRARQEIAKAVETEVKHLQARESTTQKKLDEIHEEVK